jgi:branched-chain amino acid transport system permease protein
MNRSGAFAARGALAGTGLLGTATVLGLLVPTVLAADVRDLGLTLLVYLAVAQSWNLLAGFSGQVSLGTAAFVGLGAYALTLLMLHSSAPWQLCVLASGVAGATGAALLAIPLLRLRGDYFAVGTLAAALALQAFLVNWQWAGGSAGLVVPLDRAPGPQTLFRLAVLVAAGATALVLWLRHSAFGLRLAAVRDHESAAAGLGVSVTWHRFAALVLAGTVASLAGAVVAFQSIAVVPDGVAGLGWSLQAVLMVVVGGAGTVVGPAFGVVVVYYGLTRLLEDARTLSLVIEGILLVAIVRFAPAGAWPWLARAVRAALATVSGSRGAEDPEQSSEPREPERLEVA